MRIFAGHAGNAAAGAGEGLCFRLVAVLVPFGIGQAGRRAQPQVVHGYGATIAHIQFTVAALAHGVAASVVPARTRAAHVDATGAGHGVVDEAFIRVEATPEATGVAITTYTEPHPVNINTVVSEIVLPSFEQGDKVFIATVA